MTVFELVVPALAPYGIFRVMSAERYFRGGGLPWPGLLACAAASAAMWCGAAINFARQDFWRHTSELKLGPTPVSRSIRHPFSFFNQEVPMRPVRPTLVLVALLLSSIPPLHAQTTTER